MSVFDVALVKAYESWVESHPDMLLYRKPSYKRGFIDGCTDHSLGQPHTTTSDSTAYSYGYNDGWKTLDEPIQPAESHS